jgi:hypothetical protein
MPSVTITVGNLLSLLQTLSSKGYRSDDFTLKIIDATAEIIVRDTNDMLITTLQKPSGKNDHNILSSKKRFI